MFLLKKNYSSTLEYEGYLKNLNILSKSLTVPFKHPVMINA